MQQFQAFSVDNFRDLGELNHRLFPGHVMNGLHQQYPEYVHALWRVVNSSTMLLYNANFLRSVMTTFDARGLPSQCDVVTEHGLHISGRTLFDVIPKALAVDTHWHRFLQVTNNFADIPK